MRLAIEQRRTRWSVGDRRPAFGGEYVLVTEDAPAYGVLASVRALRARGYRPWVAVVGSTTYSARSRAREGTVTVPDPTLDVNQYVSTLAEVAARLRVSAVLPGTENALLALAGRNGSFGADVALGVPSPETVDRVTDKAFLMDLVPRVGLRAPPTLLLTEGDADSIDDVEYPAVAKTSRTKIVAEDGSITSGMVRRVDTPDELRSTVSSIPDVSWLVQPYIRGTLAAVSGVAWNGEVICSHHQLAERIYPVDCGISAYAKSVPPDPELDSAIVELMASLCWSGLFQVQFIRTEEGLFVIDVNPRMYGSLALAVASGLNLPAIWVDLLLGRRPVVGRIRAATRYRSEERDAGALWAALADGSWRTVASGLVPRRRTTHAVFSIRDPLPLLTSVRHLEKARRLFRSDGRSLQLGAVRASRRRSASPWQTLQAGSRWREGRGSDNVDDSSNAGMTVPVLPAPSCAAGNVDGEQRSPSLRLGPRLLYPMKGAATRFRSLAWRVRKPPESGDGLRILFYHRVSNAPDPLSVTPHRFREQMELLARNDYTVVDIVHALSVRAAASDAKVIALSFDDGYLDVAENALPILERLGFQATVFVATAAIDGDVTFDWYEEQPPLLSWEDVTSLDAAGTLRFESHTVTHPNLLQLDHGSARHEITHSKLALERRLQRPVTCFCYPAGLFGERERRLVIEAGYSSAVSCEPGLNPDHGDRFSLYRTAIDTRDGLIDFRAKIAGAHDRPLPLRALYRRRRYGGTS